MYLRLFLTFLKDDLRPIFNILILLGLLVRTAYGQTDTLKTDTTGISEITSFIGTPSTNDENSGGFNIDVGASLVRNTITPTFNFNIHYYRDNKYKFQLGTLTNFFFERDTTEKFKMYPNTFVKMEMYWKKQDKNKTHKFDNSSWSGLGVAYLLDSQGDYFDGPTFKIYHIFGITRGAVIALELIITDNFKMYFPGMTITFL